ncbi:MAG: DUF2783 domain-containing protein [Burkholderiaceae bacterium]|jgi:hypothetical protein
MQADLPSTASSAPRALDIGGLEAVYDTLASAIDHAGADKAELFLVKLALLQAQALGDAKAFAQQVETALRDL